MLTLEFGQSLWFASLSGNGLWQSSCRSNVEEGPTQNCRRRIGHCKSQLGVWHEMTSSHGNARSRSLHKIVAVIVCHCTRFFSFNLISDSALLPMCC